MPITTYNEIDLKHDSIKLKCPFENCNTTLIKYSQDLQLINVKNSPNLIKATAEKPIMNESPIQFYKIDDVWAFDNIGVSKPTEIKTAPEFENEIIQVERILICSECDKGPLGFAGIPLNKDNDHNNLIYYLNVESVLYEY
ncbi:unnamed protein product [Candida verbasci]|uniref:Mss4-like protein n=1 Tax=Candida verbasci TaxID=1227364 RepID=A0A9W4TS63_9ASCO|nr:unnamed protein product [Candida verbasci]